MTTGEPFEVREPLLLISIAQTARAWADPYEAVRYAWKVGERGRRFELVLAREGDRVVGAYRPYEWLPATAEHFPDRRPRERRWGFNGHEAEADVWDYYVGREIPERFRRSTGNPIKYCQPGD